MPKKPLPRTTAIVITVVFIVAAAVLAWFGFHLGSNGQTSPLVPTGRAAAANAQSDAGGGPNVFPYDVEYPAIGYRTAMPTARVTQLAQKLANGTATLSYEPKRGYLDSLLEALDIDASSQVLVFSKTSLQSPYISPKKPRAIYFNDDTYVAWEQGGPELEIASMDPDLGAVFYSLKQSQVVHPRFPRQTTRCLRCHDTYELTGGGVPRFLLGSGYIGTEGQLISHEGWILTTDITPLESRWGGWYVTGRPDHAVHLGNLVVQNPADLQHLDTLRVGTLEHLDALLDTSPYVTDKSDIVALLVLQHQVYVQNLIVRANFDARQALAGAPKPTQGKTAASSAQQTVQKTVDDVTEPLVRAMLFAGAAPITGPLAGTSGFKKRFESLGPRDARGRSLRELDLDTRLFRYPLSYLVYSPAFDALPQPVKARAYERFAEILSGADTSRDFAYLSTADRQAILDILQATKPEFAAAYRYYAHTAGRGVKAEN
ncbi:MAG TPA: hypothetical protein VFY39_08170 [Gammaproteobacteria bacterium]|nr:hypothetical protein [Gammaproteobacteria bacterium]